MLWTVGVRVGARVGARVGVCVYVDIWRWLPCFIKKNRAWRLTCFRVPPHTRERAARPRRLRRMTSYADTTHVSLDCLRHCFFGLYFLTLAHAAFESGILLWQIDTLLDGKVQHFWGNTLWVVAWLRTLTVLTSGIVCLWMYVLFHSLTRFDLMEATVRLRLCLDLIWYAVLRTGVTVPTAWVATLSARRGTPVYDVLMGTVWYSAASVVLTAVLLVVGHCVFGDEPCGGCLGGHCHRGRVDAMATRTSTRCGPLPDPLQTAYVQEEAGPAADGCTTPPHSPRRDTLARLSGMF